MGVWASHMMQWVWSGFEADPINVLMLGLDNAGKTTVVYKMKLNEVVYTVPTVGFNVDTIEIGKGVKFTVWDVGGQDILRPLWHHYFQNAKGLVFVVDSSDVARVAEACNELHSVLNDDKMRSVPLVVLANKQDLPGALSTAELVDRLNLQQLGSRPWHVQATCATSGEGLFEGMHKMAEYAKKFQRETK